jgi:hypothetical protein
VVALGFRVGGRGGGGVRTDGGPPPPRLPVLLVLAVGDRESTTSPVHVWTVRPVSQAALAVELGLIRELARR